MKLSARWFAFLAILLIIGALIVWLAERYPDVLIGSDGRIDLARGDLAWVNCG